MGKITLLGFIALMLIGNIQASQPKVDSFSLVKRERDSLRHELYMSRKKIEKVRFYVKLVDKKPTQIKFLKGWVKRAIE